MIDAQVVAALCDIVQRQSQIIQAQAAALAQLDAEVMADEIAKTEKQKEMLL